MENKVDLHIHTNKSDGTVTVEELIQISKDLNMEYISITDHDTMDGVNEAIELGNKVGITVIPGMEISTGYHGEDTHVLGYGMDPKNFLLLPVFEYVQKDRLNRNLKIAHMLIEDGISIDLDMIYLNPTFGRPHFSKLLMEQGYVSSIKEGFEKYLGNGCKYYVPRSYIPIEEAIDIIHKCNGKAILAHPYQYNKENIIEFLDDVRRMGIDGIEAYYTGYNEEQIDLLVDYAKKHNLLVTGGSDFHGNNKPHIHLGELYVPEFCAKELEKSM